MLPPRRMWVSPPILHPFFVQRSNTSAGADTTGSAIGTFFLAMVCYPEVQKKAQAELDEVLNGRLPEHDDFSSLPYLSALVKEVFRYAGVCIKYSLRPVNFVSRWQPILPLGRPLFVSNIVTSCQVVILISSRRPASVDQR